MSLTPELRAKLTQWTRRLLEIAVLTDSPAARAALEQVGDPELVRALDAAHRAGGPDAVRELLTGTSPLRVTRACRELAAAVETPGVQGLLEGQKGTALIELATRGGVNVAGVQEALARLTAMTNTQLRAPGGAVATPLSSLPATPAPPTEDAPEGPSRAPDGQEPAAR